MHAIETTGRIDERGSLRLDSVLPIENKGPVRVIILFPESDEPTDQEWSRLLMAGGAFDDLADPREDIYTSQDGEPFVDEG